MADDIIPQQIITIMGIVGSLICIYLSSIDVAGSIFSMAGMILAVIYGTNTLRHIGGYSLGTGVPSIIYMLTACGLIGVVSALLLSGYISDIFMPIVALVIAFIMGYVISMVCVHVFKIEVEILTKSFISISIASMLSILSASTLVVSTYASDILYNEVICTGIILLIMIMTVMVIQNPYNSCMGPNEEQYRTLSLAISNSFLMIMVLSIISMLFNTYWYVYLAISIVGWIIAIHKYVKYTFNQAAVVKWSGLWSNTDGDD
ncbi:MAG: tetrahydromethanopterin S-methyltransferase subunit C [Methanosphaera sp.]|nr:tetrahydromethanopterin S-methyltransferase subunit C [Methanosphaera sp.]